MTISLPALPYPVTALEPHISRSTVEYHYGQHHAAYVARTNELLSKSKPVERTLVEILRAAHASGDTALFNVAAQSWNHDFYWHSMRPHGGGLPHGAIATLIEKDFGSQKVFVNELRETALAQFGSGWVWVVLNNGHLETFGSANADNPLVYNLVPLLTIDVWEHAYYLDYQHRRALYLTKVVEHLLNWDFANRNLELAVSRSATPIVAQHTTHNQMPTP